ncbi:peptidoglycan binding protein CsiV [Gammaproteobacteria bacterium]|nr:peptidoglycan binding protein CsiV [Gammaproteobacteria bacterium]
MFTRLIILFTAFSLALMVQPTNAQDFSYDGNRWYEVELSIFTNQKLGSINSELAIPEKTILEYPVAIRELIPTTSTFLIDFDDGAKNEVPILELTSEFNLRFGRRTTIEDEEVEEELPESNPVYSPAERNFRISDFNSDAFVALGPEYHTFNEINQDLGASPEHRLLYHAVWRQPVLNKVQSTAVFIHGGDQYGLHSELEGSVTISYNVNRIDIDANLWRNFFTPDITPSSWSVPVPPFIHNDEDSPEYAIESLSHMLETRSMRSNMLHYLDHPDFGVLVQVRPYQLPDNFDFD